MTNNNPMALLIERINSLQDICTESGITNLIELPQIVVIGGQSCGKSSVLENIVGRDFLPRGVGIVTRRPLILQLIYCKQREYVRFNHTENEFVDFELVKQEIVNETARSIKNKNDVTHVPITLKLYSPNVMTLTLVDLPGLVKVPTNDQPKNIVSRVEEISRKYITNKNAIIIAVSSATSDITNSDALQLAKTVDQGYERTLGILTKVDLMDTGTDIVDILAGRVLSLKMGFIPVVNRGQKDIKSHKRITDALIDEKKFFETHQAYKRNNEYCGTSYLRTKLTNVLYEHIRQTLPELQEKVSILITRTQLELDELGAFNLSPKEHVLRTINEISKKFTDLLSGTVERGEELCGGARLSYTLHQSFSSFLNSLNALQQLRNDNIRTIMLNSSGSSGTLFFSQRAFEILARQSVSIFKPHILKLVSVIFTEMVRMMHSVVSTRFPKLNEKISTSLINLFKRRSEHTTMLVSALIEWNIESISTRHPDFVRLDELTSEKVPVERKKSEAVKKVTAFDKIPNILRVDKDVSEVEAHEINLVKTLVVSYFDINRKIILDQVPKAIMTNLVSKSLLEMQEHLFREVYECDGIETLCEEDENIKELRERLKRNLKAMRNAYDLMCSL